MGHSPDVHFLHGLSVIGTGVNKHKRRAGWLAFLLCVPGVRQEMTKGPGLGPDRGLLQIAEIVHDVDLKDSEFNRPDATRVNLAVRGTFRTLGRTISCVLYPEGGNYL